MSRTMTLVRSSALGFPRVSGDEPTRLGVATRISKFSPRERG